MAFVSHLLLYFPHEWLKLLVYMVVVGIVEKVFNHLQGKYRTGPISGLGVHPNHRLAHIHPATIYIVDTTRHVYIF